MTSRSIKDHRTGKDRKISRRDLFQGLFQKVRGDSLEKKSSGVDPDMVYADRLLREGQYDKAAHLYSRRLKKEPRHLEAMPNLGYCHFMQGDYAGARQSWEKLLGFRPRDNFALLYTGLACARLGDDQGALENWKLYYDIRKPMVQREINLILARQERGDELNAREMADLVQEALEKQEKK
ncbi:tetratricopeptide repeat protein [Desulfonatronospira sp.]|uniref:tetratricopeptide repeat protein n=1 Tax=Desulfonatronospira sp. TaxID=1962951 RepID=UPI0025C44258|nr:tetratricopeptide repeat protein [Desulfonatronospira sp.]